MHADFVIVGSGIVGMATAYELKARFPTAAVVIIEKEARPAVHASGRNSGVLHSGIYYGADTIKARVCAEGARRMRQFADEYGIPFSCLGKVIIATSEADIPALKRLMKNAQDNAIRAELLDEQQIKSLEPYANPCGYGIYSPDTCVIDSQRVAGVMHDLLVSKGVRFLFDNKVVKCEERGRYIVASQEKINYGYMFNCAGAQADKIAAQYGLGEGYALVPFKGLYYKLAPSKSGYVRGNIYPAPDTSLPFLGVHFTRVASGDVYVGPTAIPALGRENYGVIQGAGVLEVTQILRHLAALYIENKNDFRRMVHEEIGKYSKGRFLSAAQKLVPDVKEADLLPSAKVGIRPQLVDLRGGKLVMDFVVEQTEHSLHVLNAISPAFTSAFKLSELLVDMTGHK